jgi:membrane protease YdiL (CAAX protease family)
VRDINGGDTGGGLQNGIKRPGVAGTSILFSITILLFIFLGYRVQSKEFYSGIIITEFVLISLPAILFLLISRFRFKEIVRLNHSRFLNFFLIFWIVIFAIPLAAVFNMLNLFIVDAIFGKVVVESMPVGDNGLQLLVSILVIAGSAGICEEFLFRGVVQRGFEAFGPFKAIFLAAFLFSLTHLDFQKILHLFAGSSDRVYRI